MPTNGSLTTMTSSTSNIEAVARDICAKQLSRHTHRGADLAANVDRYWHCVAAELEAGLIDDAGDRVPGIGFQEITEGGRLNGVYFSVLIDEDSFGMGRDQVYEALQAENIQTRRYYYPPLHRQTVYSDLAPLYHGKLPNTDLVASMSLALPLYSHMTAAEVDLVCGAIVRLHEHRNEIRDGLTPNRK